MTKQEAKAKFVAYLRTQVGYHEGADNYNKYADSDGLQALYGWSPQRQPWCDIFFDAGMLICFGLDATSKMTYQPLGQGSAACRFSAAFYAAHGAFYQTPEVGDQIFFYDSAGEINHTGAVESVSGGVVYTIEGNHNDSVGRGAYAISSPRIAGFGRPDWSVVADADAGDIPEAPQTPQAPTYKYHSYMYAVQTNLLKKGDYGPQVKNMQTLLDAHGFRCDPDGEFGEETYLALKNFQAQAGIQIDGEWGGQSFNAMWSY